MSGLGEVDTNQDECIETTELLPFMDLWYLDSSTNTMSELMDAIGTWTDPPPGCP